MPSKLDENGDLPECYGFPTGALGANVASGALSRVGVGAPVSVPMVGLPTGASGATDGLLRGLSSVGVGTPVSVPEVGLPTGASGATDGLLRGLSRVGVGIDVTPELGLPTGARGATDGLLRGLSSVGVGAPVNFTSSGANDGLPAGE